MAQDLNMLAAGGEAAADRPTGPTVRRFRQIVLWPLQLEIAPGSRSSDVASVFEKAGGGCWRLVEDEFGCPGQPLEERHYREFVTFLPHVQRFLYGDAPGPVRKLGYGDAPLRVYRRTDVVAARIVPRPGAAPVICSIAHIDLHLFHEVDVVVLACEIEATNLPLDTVQDLMYRFGRAYPPGWTAGVEPLHCPAAVELLDAGGRVLARSDYEHRQRYVAHVGETRTPCFAAHWEFLLTPIVPHTTRAGGPLRFRQVEYYRMPQMAFLAFDRLADIGRADTVRLAFASGPGDRGAGPYSERFLADFERQHCYDRFYQERPTGAGINTRFLLCGHALTVLAEGDPAHVEDNERGLLSQFRHQYFLLFLICHFHKAALLMLSDRLVAAVKRLEASSRRSAREFRREIYRLQEAFMRFTQRYWFADVSDQVQARDLFRMQRAQLDSEQLYRDLRSEIFDSVQYLDSDILRRQTGSMHRLTAVTIVGLIGTVATGFLGMNLIAAADQPLETKLWYFGSVLAGVTALTVGVLMAARPLTALFDRMSGEG